MTSITLHRPIASHPDLERLHLFAGRHLGEDEFDQRQHYANARLAPLAALQNPGVISGLHLQVREESGPADAINVMVNPGSGITPSGSVVALQSPLRCSWQDLVDEYKSRRNVSDTTGLYYLTMHQSQNSIDPPNVDPCQRTAFDPTRDTRLVALSSLRLRRLDIDNATVINTPPHKLQNIVCADHVEAEFMSSYSDAVPLALVAFHQTSDGVDLLWVSEAAGRYTSSRHAGYLTLLNQTQSALREIMRKRTLGGNAGFTLAEYLNNNMHLDYLPASGQLPLSWLQDIAGTQPELAGLPAHLGIDMIPVRESALDELLERHLPRRVIDLRQPAGDRIRLLLAMKSSAYRPDLLDIPATDQRLEKDIFTYCKTAYEKWLDWHSAFDDLYYIAPGVTSDRNNSLSEDDVAELKLPEPEAAPLMPNLLFSRLKQAAADRLQLDLDLQSAPQNYQYLPYPYNQPDPEPTPAFLSWAPKDGDTFYPPQPETREEHGLIGQYELTEKDLDTLEEDIRGVRKRLEGTRDLLMLKRQQLDSQTVSLAALAGGVAGDGKGMQVARWLPYASLNTDSIPKEASATIAASTTTTTQEVKVASTDSTSETTDYRLADTRYLDDSSIKTLSTDDSYLRTLSYDTTIKDSYYTQIAPEKYSAFELSLTQDRVNRLQVPKAAVSKPAFNSKEFSFGVMDHISPEFNEYQKVYRGMQDLLTTVEDVFDDSDGSTLRTSLENLSSELKSPTTLDNESRTQADQHYDSLPTDERPTRTHVRGLFANQKRYEAIFTAGKILTRWISVLESRYDALETELQLKLRQQQRLIAEQTKRKASISNLRRRLRQLDSIADEALGDYSVAQQLLDEDWRRVWEANNERTRILTTEIEGLYYIRVRQAEVSRPMADPLPLRRDNPNDLVPGCEPDPEADMPEALLTFWQAVKEIPVQSWNAIAPLTGRLNVMTDFRLLGKIRETRLSQAYDYSSLLSSPVAYAGKASAAARSVEDSPAFKELADHSRARLKHWSARPLPATRATLAAAEVARVISLEDLQNHSHRKLRHAGNVLLEKLEHCQLCLQHTLSELPGSVRLHWGQLAEDNRLPVEAIGRWPGLKRAEEISFNTTRTLSELIEWWFKQLGSEADNEARKAMRDMIRATVIYASLGNPQEIVKGTIFSPPLRIAMGERFRVLLNRAVIPGKTLQLLSHRQEVAAELTIEENETSGTRVRITKVLREDIDFNSNVSVLGRVR